MLKKILLPIILIVIVQSALYSDPGMDFLITTPLLEERGTHFTAVSLITKLLEDRGGDVDALEEFSNPQFVREISVQWHATFLASDYQIQVWNGADYVTLVNVVNNTEGEVTHPLGDNGLFINKYRINILKTYYYSCIREITLHGSDPLSGAEYSDTDVPGGEYEYTVTSLHSKGEESIPSLPVSVCEKCIIKRSTLEEVQYCYGPGE